KSDNSGLTADDGTICSGDIATLTANANAGSGTITSYTWKRNGSPIGPNSSVLSATQGGSYIVIVTNSNGCSVTSTPAVTITVTALPTVSYTLSSPSPY